MPVPTNATDGAVDSPIQKSAFLDSLELVSLYKLWDVCDSANISLDATLDWTKPKWNQLKEALESVGIATNALNRPEDVNRGLNLYSSIGPASNDYRFFTSHMCWSELHHVLLEAIGLESLIHHGVPLSLREKRPQLLYRQSLSDSELEYINDRVFAFRESLKLDYSMDIIEVEDTATGIDITSADIWNRAEVIWSHMLMTAVDAYVCAAAVLIEADAFVAGDSSRRDILRKLRDPTDDWQTAANTIQAAFGLSSSEQFPLSVTPPAVLP